MRNLYHNPHPDSMLVNKKFSPYGNLPESYGLFYVSDILLILFFCLP